MKRHGNLFEKIASIENLIEADRRARKGKGNQYGVMLFDNKRDENFRVLHEMLINKTYKTSDYSTFKIYEPKEREVYRLPYFPDRITHHAIMNYLEGILTPTFTADTYSCIKGKGIHAALKSVRSALKDVAGTKYCLKLDIKKFYPNIDHSTLKLLLRRKIKDNDLMWLLDGIIDSAPGIPIGNYLSQYFANYYLTGFDHWLKEVKGVKYYFRYADDFVLLSDNKQFLHQVLLDIKTYLKDNLKLEVKNNYQVFPISARGIDYVGYRIYHTHVLMRKSIKQRFARMMSYRRNQKSFVAYYGWAKHCNSNNLLKKTN